MTRTGTAALVAALLVLAGCGSPQSSTGSAQAGPTAQQTAPRGEVPDGPPPSRGGAADGHVTGRVKALSGTVPAVTRLDPDLLAALRQAALDAAHEGIEIDVTSGWRSRSYQAELFEQAVRQYGSEELAARWVARPGTSAHESGDAVDLGPELATHWLWLHGPSYGLCQIYRNETWHFELRPEAVREGCPALYADPTHDPRLGQ